MRDEPDLLPKVFSGVVENFAYMFAETPEEGEFPHGEPPFVMARMTFSGPFKGTVYLGAPEAMCRDLAANVLGLKPGDEPAPHLPRDAFQELLSVTCGHLLTALAGEDPVFDLAPPEMATLDQKGWETFVATPGAVQLVVDEHPVLLRFIPQPGS
jgi:chemotaxis protein CheY-P-specific phosphatase CheC